MAHRLCVLRCQQDALRVEHRGVVGGAIAVAQLGHLQRTLREFDHLELLRRLLGQRAQRAQAVFDITQCIQHRLAVQVRHLVLARAGGAELGANSAAIEQRRQQVGADARHHRRAVEQACQRCAFQAQRGAQAQLRQPGRTRRIHVGVRDPQFRFGLPHIGVTLQQLHRQLGGEHRQVHRLERPRGKIEPLRRPARQHRHGRHRRLALLLQRRQARAQAGEQALLAHHFEAGHRTRLLA